MIRAAFRLNSKPQRQTAAATANRRTSTSRDGKAEPWPSAALAAASLATGSSGRTHVAASAATGDAGSGEAGFAADARKGLPSSGCRARTAPVPVGTAAAGVGSGETAPAADDCQLGLATRRAPGCPSGRSGVAWTGTTLRGAGRSAGGATAGGGAAGAGGSAGAGVGSGAGAGGTSGAASGGRNACGSRYPSGSDVSRTPSCTYGTEYSGTPLVPTIATRWPSATTSPRPTSAAPRCSNVTV